MQRCFDAGGITNAKRIELKFIKSWQIEANDEINKISLIMINIE